MRCWCGCLSGVRCRLFAYGPADATAIQKPHRLLPHLTPDKFYLSGTGLPRLSWKRGHKTGVVLVVISFVHALQFSQVKWFDNVFVNQWMLTPLKLRVIHTHQFNGPLSRTTRVSQYQKGKTNLDFTEARDSEWQRHQLGHMQVCTSLRTDNHASTPPLSFFIQCLVGVNNY